MSTVTEMIAYLQTLPGEMEVIMSKDGEGNGFSPWCGEATLGEYDPDSTYSGEFNEYGDENGDTPHPSPNAIALWPIN
jgi:hypothetical protein